MLIAIFLVLVLIACILAPWLIGVIAAGVALYGAWIVLVAVLLIALICASGIFSAFKRLRSRSRLESQIAESNRIYAEKERARANERARP